MKYVDVADVPSVAMSLAGFDKEQNRLGFRYVCDMGELRTAETSLRIIEKAMRELQAQAEQARRVLADKRQTCEQSRKDLESALGRSLTVTERECTWTP